jgi:glutathione peroxidase
MASIYDFKVEKNHGGTESLEKYRGKVLMVVNTASQCGLTPQYKELQRLHDRYGQEGLCIIAFPCNQFGKQEPGSADEIEQFCQLNYGVTFPVMAKVNVNGSRAIPLFRHLKKAAPGLLGSRTIKWNFTKFLIDRTGESVTRYAPQSSPLEMEAQIQELLKK